MTERDLCPTCQAGNVRSREGRLEQSGYTYLPTTVWSCDVCGYARYEPALGTRWRPAADREIVAVPASARRAA